MRTTLLTCLVGAAIVVAGGRQAMADNPRQMQKDLDRATISLGDAVRLALEQVPDSKAVEASFETENGNTTYEIEVVAGGKHRIVEVNPIAGAVEKIGGESIEENQQDARERDETAISHAPVTLAQAIKVALEHHADAKACRVEPKRHEGKLSFSVELLSHETLTKVHVDATTGHIMPDAG